ncbi:MAG: FkbM family methyltransferase [Thermosynechococcaceae cyanobacterium MS004]|nr:FkbM family methyltransferase [Thermosynechococcaceae cyanobacterium MS004]
MLIKQLIKQVSNSFGYELSKVPNKSTSVKLDDYPCIDLLDLVVQNYTQSHPDIFFIQIGAHDGVSADPSSRQIRKYENWRGILVEPQSDSFQELLVNYEKDQDRLIFEQLAVGNQDGSIPFFTVRKDIADLTFWLPQSASFDRDHVLGALYYWKYVRKLDSIPEDFNTVIEEIQVPTLTMRSLLAKHSVTKVDLFLLATPGFDFDIIQGFPFDQFKPPLICFEYNTLQPQQRQAALKFLADLGYSVGRFGSRALAALDVPTLLWTISEY